MKLLLAALMMTGAFITYGQTIKELKSIKPNKEFDNIHVHKMCEDDHQSSFVIWVKDSVPEHYHANHTECIVVISGKGVMTMDDTTFTISKGDYINVPEGTKHSVKEVNSHTPLKVLSIQTPLWDPKDRISTKKKQQS